ncbi:MAG: glycosyltransferase family 4 protein [Candidatus Thiodiazotropha sp.]
MKLKVLLLCRYPRLGASSRLRSYQYLPLLAEAGIDVTVLPLFDEAYLQRFYATGAKRPSDLARAYLVRLRQLLRVKRYDLVWLEKELFPWMPAWFECGLRRLGVPYLVDYDDAIFHRYDQSSSAWVRRLLGRKIDRVMACATLVTAGNAYLAERARRAGVRDVRILPTVVDITRYPLKQHHQRNELTIGWIGSPSTAGYLELIREPLARLAGEHRLRLLIIGADALTIPGVEVEALPWSEEREAELIRQCDVGVMPLKDDLWERGKCGYKLIQYLASGLPVVASPVGVNREIVEPGVNGYLADSDPAWEAAFTRLIGQPQLRRDLGLMGRDKVQRQYALDVTAPLLIEALQQAANATRVN